MEIGKWTVAIPWLLSLGTVLVGIWQFGVQQAQANKRPFLEQQLTICIEATDAASRLATETDLKLWEAERAKFWRLYWGRLALVEDRAVESSMVAFGNAMPQGPITQEDLPIEALQVPSLNLAHAARNLILSSWNVKLAPLQGEKAKPEGN